MATAYRRVEKTLDDIVDDHLRTEELFLYSGVTANVQLGVQAVEQNELREDEQHHRWRGDVVRWVLQGCATRGMFAQNGNYIAVLNAVYEAFPQKGRSEANNRSIVRAACRYQIPFDAEHLVDLVATPEVWATLHDSRECEEQRESNRKRQEMIDFVTKGGTSNFSYYPINSLTGKPSTNPRTYDKDGYLIEYSRSGGRAKKNDKCLFDDAAEFRFCYDQIVAKRTAVKLHEEGLLGKWVRHQGKQQYENKYGGDPGLHQPSPTPAGEAVLVDPRNGQAITTRLGLIQYINSSQTALAQLVKPRGAIIRERALAVDVLLNKKD